MSERELREAVEDALKLPFLHDFVRLVFAAYRQADDECRSLAREVAHDYRGHRRRALIEQGIPGIAARHADQGVSAVYRPNHCNTSYFAQVTSDRVLFTQSCVETPEAVVRRAEFRKTLARSCQPRLFDADEPPPDSPIYAIAIHGEDHRQRDPYFIDIVVPGMDCDHYVLRVQLFEVCHSLVASLTQPAQEEVVQDEARPALRPAQKEESR